MIDWKEDLILHKIIMEILKLWISEFANSKRCCKLFFGKLFRNSRFRVEKKVRKELFFLSFDRFRRMRNRICIIWRHGNVEIVHNFLQKLQTEILERKWVYSANCKIHINQRNWGTCTHKCLDDSQFGRNSHWNVSQRESKTLIHACLDRQENYWMKVKTGKEIRRGKHYFIRKILEIFYSFD